MTALALGSFQYEDLVSCETPTRRHSVPIAAASTCLQAREQVELQLTWIQKQFERLEVDIEVFEARVTGDYPAISTVVPYDVAGLEAEPGFSMTFEDAVALGRRLHALIPEQSETSDGELDY